MQTFSDQPYCKECGYSLVGLTRSSKCPECGKPIVEVLVRDSFPGKAGYRYQSERTLWGLPLLSIASGPHGPEPFGKPVGVIAIGDAPRGIVAIGGRAIGVVAIGGIALGGITFGGLSIGVLAMGGCCLGILAMGGLAVGAYAVGGLAMALLKGIGGQVIYLLPR